MQDATEDQVTLLVTSNILGLLDDKFLACRSEPNTGVVLILPVEPRVVMNSFRRLVTETPGKSEGEAGGFSFNVNLHMRQHL